MRRERVKADLEEIVSRLSATDIQEEHILGDDLGLDSLDAVEVIIKIEGKYGISLPDEDMEGIKSKSFGELVDYTYAAVLKKEGHGSNEGSGN